MTSQIKNPVVYVAMSGGVDSSVAAALLKKQGFEVVGVYMKPWTPKTVSKICPWKQDREDAMRVAAVLGIPLLTWDFSKEYKKEVADYMINEYRVGRTPNPDVMCNKYIKFGLFLKRALKEDADYIATGHYVRKAEVRKFKNLKVYKLLQAKDKNKDQSYFLWTLTQKELKYCLFPIGDYIKPEVRKLAKKFNLPNFNKKDSQGICFIGPVNMKEFLKQHIRPKNGKIIDSSAGLGQAKIVGEHDGVQYYTIGQRHGLNIKNGQGPYYVTGKDLKNNIIYVGQEKDLGGQKLKISEFSWVNSSLRLPAKVDVKIRYRSRSEKAILYKNSRLKFKSLIRAITPGQSVVFYRGQELLGGGIIM